MFNNKLNLLDPSVSKKIVNAIKPPQPIDKWQPAKIKIGYIYQNYIRPNIGIIIFVVVIILFLIYRYRVVKNNREKKMIEKIYKHINDIPDQEDDENDSKNILDEYIKILSNTYKHQKELSREPIYK